MTCVIKLIRDRAVTWTIVFLLVSGTLSDYAADRMREARLADVVAEVEEAISTTRDVP